MKRIPGLMLFLSLLLLWSCNKNNDLPRVTAITHGHKWTLQIGSTPEAVYGQLQALGAEKAFNQVALVYRPSYGRPEKIKDQLPYYDALTLQSSAGRMDRAVIQLDHDTVSAVAVGGGLLDEVSGWPRDYPEKIALQKGDPTDLVYEKLTRIWQMADYQHYLIILPDKPLDRPYDPDMANYDQWAFDFTTDLGSGQYGQYSVRLYFNHHHLAKVKISYKEGQTYV